ncbi:type II toxin-antitoxin system RelE/ParE family toxin [Phragmitibacter flavus]|uniref:Type II toxin-antitoxin system RelE/ParE family toxin n=1 Tax=Phragmitibacter flavus TaxID=2576071 RepID=A0A5R8KBR7_9BACT|nr:type II toxin-antitoxin system RelE/ParE family toxin [Phragmitibacter flavus]TLD69763.1 type II toxin-antitoxin system RelE/ParE family toxin [Phragmitibacter flavus]
MIKLRISEEAFADLDEGFWFYEAQEVGLGDYFAVSLRAEIEGLRISAGIHRRVYLDYHRLLARVFPFSIFYTFEDDEVVVWAVIDGRRDPEWIRRHLGE